MSLLIGCSQTHKSTITSVSVYHAGCRGICPRYTLKLSRGDFATYDGKQNIEKMGMYGGKIDFDAIATFLESQHIDDYTGSYNSGAHDAGVRMTITRPDRTDVIDIDSTSSGPLAPVRVRLLFGAIDGLADHIRWSPMNAIDSFLGYFLSEDENGEALTIGMFQGDTPTKAGGISRIAFADRCPADFALRLHLVGNHADMTERAYRSGVEAAGPEIPLSIVPDAYGIFVGTGKAKQYLHRVDFREYWSAFYPPSARSANCRPN